MPNVVSTVEGKAVPKSTFVDDLMMNIRGALLNFDMGLGKTLISIVFYLIAKRLCEERGIKLPPCLVVCPATLVEQWISQILFHTYLTEDAICKYKEKGRDLSKADDKYFIITSFNLVGMELSKPVVEKPRSTKVYLKEYHESMRSTYTFDTTEDEEEQQEEEQVEEQVEEEKSPKKKNKKSKPKKVIKKRNPFTILIIDEAQKLSRYVFSPHFSPS